MVREKGKSSVISGIRAGREKAEAPGWFLQKDGSYLSAKPKVGEGRLATGRPLCLSSWFSALWGKTWLWWCECVHLSRMQSLQGQAEVGERQMERVEGVVLWASKFKC